MIWAVINFSAILSYILCKGRCEFDDRKWNLKQKWNNNKWKLQCKKPMKHREWTEDYAWNLCICVFECDKDCEY